MDLYRKVDGTSALAAQLRERLSFEASMDRIVAQHLASLGGGAQQGPKRATEAGAGGGASMAQSMDRILAQQKRAVGAG